MTTTDSHEREAQAIGGAGTVHSAVHDPGGSADSASNARPCTRVREVSGESAQSQDQSAPAVDLDKHPDPVTWSDRLRGVKDAFTPPDIWAQDRPSLSKVWAHATRGDWTGDTGLPRRIGQAYAIAVAVPLTAVAYVLAWTAERPSRAAAAVVLLVLLIRIPPLSWLI